MKKLISLLLCAALLCTLVVPAFAVEDGYVEVDVDELEVMDPAWAEISLGGFDRVPIWVDDEPGEPTYTLYVNGEPTDVALTVENWTTYADGAELAEVLGVESEGGLVPVREMAEAAGWDVAWYSGWGYDQEVCLWDGDTYRAELSEKFAPLHNFLKTTLESSMELICGDTCKTVTETATVKLTRFSTLDGDKDYTLKLNVTETVGRGRVDAVFTFDVLALLDMLDMDAIAGLLKEQEVELSLSDLMSLLKGGKVELLMDLTAGVTAFKAPILGIIDPELAGWQVMDLSDLGMDLSDLSESVDFVSTLYDQMVNGCRYMGAHRALENFEATVNILDAFAGADCFTQKGDAVVYTLTTDRANGAFAAILEEATGPEGVKPFKSFEVSYSAAPGLDQTLSLHLRPDMKGLAKLAGTDTADTAVVLQLALPALDMDLTASANLKGGKGTEQLTYHWNNQGKLVMDVVMDLAASSKAPRDPADIPEIAEQLDGGLDLEAISGPVGVFLAK